MQWHQRLDSGASGVSWLALQSPTAFRRDHRDSEGHILVAKKLPIYKKDAHSQLRVERQGLHSRVLTRLTKLKMLPILISNYRLS